MKAIVLGAAVLLVAGAKARSFELAPIANLNRPFITRAVEPDTSVPKPAPAGPTTFLDVTVSNVRNDHGHVLVAVCVPAEFLSPHCRHFGSAPAHAGTVTVQITDIPPGTYAVQAFQDENDNLKIDRNFIGLPTEGIGFSNNARFHFGPPGFNDAAIALGPGGGRISVGLRYVFD